MRTDKLIGEIRKANILQIDDILDAAMNRKRELYPDWELFYCAAEKKKISSPEDMIRAAWEFEHRIRLRNGK
jgi:hypothetical protein